MKNTDSKLVRRQSRHRRIRASVVGTSDRPRLAFFRSNKNVYAQVIDDGVGKTLVGGSSLKEDASGSVAKAEKLGTMLAEKMKTSGITKVVFDRGGFTYTGSVKVFVDSIRAGGVDV